MYYISSIHLHNFQGFLNQITNSFLLSLSVINLITKIVIENFIQIKNRQQLSIIRHQSFTSKLRAFNKFLNDLRLSFIYITFKAIAITSISLVFNAALSGRINCGMILVTLSLTFSNKSNVP